MASCGEGKIGNRINENAVSSSSQQRSYMDSIRRCCLCHESVQGKTSKLLTCLHTVCSPCHISHTKGGELTCPACGCKIESRSIVENFVAHGLDANDKPVIRCNEHCPDGAPAKFHCTECDDHLCAKCKEAHQRVKLTRDHRITQINDGRAVNLLTTCPKHPQEELALFCNKCLVLTCRDCQLSKDHSGHHDDYLSVDEAANVQRKQLLTFVQQSRSVISSLQGTCDLVSQRLDEVEKLRESYSQDLRQAAQTLHSALKSRVSQLGDWIKGACDQQRQVYENVRKPLEAIKEMGTQASHFATAAASLNDKHALLRSVHYSHVQRGTITRSHKSCNFNVLQRQQQPMNLRLPTRDLARAITDFGVFTFEPLDLPSSSASDLRSPQASTSTAIGSNANAESQYRVQPQICQQPPPQLTRLLTSPANATGTQVAPHTVVDPQATMATLGPMVEQRLSTRPETAVLCRASVPRQYAPHQGRGTLATMLSEAPPNSYIQAQLRMQVRHPQPGQFTRTAAPTLIQYPTQQQQRQLHRHTNPYCGAPSGYNMMQVPNSPNAVSSTSITPPQGPHQNQQNLYGSEWPSQSGNFCSNPARLQPPPLYSAIADFNTAPPDFAKQRQIQKQLHQQQGTAFFPRTLSARDMATHQYAANQPRLLGPLPPQPQQLMPNPLPRLVVGQTSSPAGVYNNGAMSGASCSTASLSPNLARSSAAFLSVPNPCELAITVDQTVANCTRASIENAADPMLSPASEDIVSTILGMTNGCAPIELVPISPDPKEVTENLPAADDGLFQMNTGSTEQASTVASAPAVAVAENAPSPQKVDSPKTPMVNVSSTTVDSETIRLGSAAGIGQQAGDRLRHMARKSITVMRITDSPPRPKEQAVASPLFLSGLGVPGTSGVFNVSPSDSNEIRRSTSDDGTVTTSEQPDAATVSRKGDSDRSWDDYCCICNNGGKLVCCEADGCRRVFHYDHHIPEIDELEGDSEWNCIFCIDLDAYRSAIDEVPKDDRKTMSEYELKVCQRILLSLYTHAESAAFHEPVDKKYTEYFEVIQNPMDFSSVRRRLDWENPHCYMSVMDFIQDLNQVFLNCDKFNTADRDPNLRAIGKIVGKYYVNLIKEYFPDLVSLVAPVRKRRLSRSSSSGSSVSAKSSRRRRIFVQEEEES